MKIKPFAIVKDAENILHGKLEIRSKHLKNGKELIREDLIAYPPLINSHDHLIGNWYPRNGDNRPYANSDLWVEDMKYATTFLERNKVWINDSNFDLLKGNAYLLTNLGVYKNIFSGCSVVQDHISKQKDEYYDNFPINVLKNYTQCHSVSMGNWWGDKSAGEEWRASKLKMPFVLHLAEGIDDAAKKDFENLKEQNLLHPNTLIVHGIALTRKNIEECAKVGASICWCPESNDFLIGRSIDVPYCLEKGVKVVLGTDSTQSGSWNILTELRSGHKMYPEIALKELFKMISSTAQKTLFLPKTYGNLQNPTSDVLLVKKRDNNEFANLLAIDSWDIDLFIYRGTPIYGETEWLQYLDIDQTDYYIFSNNLHEKFVIGHPEKITDKIDSYLNYHKKFPFIPFT